jgi:hypothetical protein
VLSGNGDGTFGSPATVFTGAAGKLAVGDFLANGRQDIVTYTRSGTVNLLANNGDGTFPSPITTQTGLSLGAVTVGDFFRDGKFSLAFILLLDGDGDFDDATTGGGVSVLRSNGDGTFQSPVNFLVGVDSRSLVVGDFAGHGLFDLATADFGAGSVGPGTVSVLLNQAGTTAPPTVQSTVVNDGSVQRSSVTSLSVTFSTQVSLSAGALEVQHSDGSDVAISVSTSVVGGKTVAVITFTGSDVVGGSLPDGSYTLTVHAGLVHDGSGQAMAQDATLSFFRLAGDADGDGDLDDGDVQAATVTGVALNEGEPAGGQVHSITIHISGQVSVQDGAFELLQQGVGPVGLVVSTSVTPDGNTTVVITFTGDKLLDGALPDGSYTLTVHGELIQDAQGQPLGGIFSGDVAADFSASDGGTDLVNAFHPA